MVGLEQELQTSKAVLEPIRAQRETAKGEINVQRERLDRIEVRCPLDEAEYVTNAIILSNEWRTQKEFANKPKRTNCIGSRNTNRFKIRFKKMMIELHSCGPNLRSVADRNMYRPASDDPDLVELASKGYALHRGRREGTR
jgi:hypothetical protein